MGSSTSKDSIANLVLANLEISREISSVETEKTAEASLIRRHYDASLDEVLEDVPFPESTMYGTLGLVASAPNDDWLYSYRYPADCLFARRIVTVNGRDELNPPPFRLGSDTQGILIYTNENPATLEYTFRLTDTRLYPAAFVQAFAAKLASKCSSLSKMKDAKATMLKLYDGLLIRAAAKAAREQQQKPEQDSEMIRARG